MNIQCVPNWHLEEEENPTPPKAASHSNSLLPSVEYEVAELTWENGQLAMHGLGIPRVGHNKPPATWDKPRAGGTLESIVNQATGPKSAVDVPWFNPADALVPCNNEERSTHVRELGACSTLVGSCSGAVPVPTMDGGVGKLPVGINTNGSMSESATWGTRESQQFTLDTWETELGGTSMASPENTISKTSTDDHTNSQHKTTGDEDGKRKLSTGKYSGSTKRSRAAAIHNQSERKRRDKINQRMKTLQKMVPNSSKTDKASMLDEVIDYLKLLQAHVHMTNKMNMPSMMLPLAMQQQQLQMSMMGMGMGMGMGMPGVMDMNAINRAAAAALPPVIPPAAAFMHPADCVPPLPTGPVMPAPLATLLARQPQPMTIDAYSRLAAMYQQMQQPPVSKN